MQQEKATPFGWFMLIVIIGAVIWAVIPKQQPQLSPAQERELERRSNAFELREAQKKCADVEYDTELFKKCVEVERQRISDAYDERAREEMGR